MTWGSEGGTGTAAPTARRERRDKGRVLLSSRDLAVLRWTGEQYAARLDQLQKLFGRLSRHGTKAPGVVSPKTAERIVKRWEQVGLATVQKKTYEDPAWVWLTKRGLDSLGLPYGYVEPSLALLAHYYWTNQVRLYVEARRADAEWIPERRLRKEAGHHVVRTGEGQHFADAEIVLPGTAGGLETTVALEVELTRKKAERLKGIMTALAGTYPTIWYFTTDETDALVRHMCAELPAGERDNFRIYALRDTL